MRILAALLCIAAFHAAPASAQALMGRASVIDGDTVEIQGTRVRLSGIDAPESAQSCEGGNGAIYRCGQKAAMALDARIAGRPVRCEQRDMDRYGRVVGVCYVGNEDLNAWMVGQGLAVAYTRYSRDYAGLEREAQARRRGIWEGKFEDPSEYRMAHRRN